MVKTQSRGGNIGQVGGQVLVNVFQHQREVQAPAHWCNRCIQQPGHQKLEPGGGLFKKTEKFTNKIKLMLK